MALTRKKFLIAKIESTYGTDPSPVGGSDAVQVTNLELTPIESDNVQAAAFQGFIGNSTRGTLVANKRVSVTFDVELAGSGTAGTAPAFGPLLKSCGLSETIVSSTSVTYAPVSSSFSSATIYCFYDGTQHKITGARGTVSFNMTAGQFALASFNFIGIYNAPDGTALSGSFTVANQAAALEVNDTNVTTATFHGVTSSRIESFDLALNNELLYKETASNKEVLITNRAPGGTAVIEAPAIGTTDFFAKAVAVATGSTSLVLGATGGNIVTINAAQTDITGCSYADTNGVIALSMPYLALPTTAGNNEMSLVFT
jgi:Phage tail tube protein